MNKHKQSQNNILSRTKNKPEQTTRLGDALTELMKNRISPMHARFGSVSENWDFLLPNEIARHCSLTDISGGQLKVMVDSPAYLYELKLCSAEFVKHLQQQCPQAKIKKIKFVVGDSEYEGT